MPPTRADTTHIAPYLTHTTTHHGQITLVPPDNNGRRRGKREQNEEWRRRLPREAPVRFSSVSSPRPSSTSGIFSRIRRLSRAEQSYNESLDDIPNYPPPSFQEAISSPPISVCASTTTLGHFTAPQASQQDSDSDSDDASSLLDVESVGLPTPRGTTSERLSPTPHTPRGRGILDSEPDDAGYGPALPLNVRAHKRHLSLSPLRTLFPSRNARDSSYALSAQSTPSTNSLAFARTSQYSRSTASLRNITMPAPPSPPSPSTPSVRSENTLGSRRFFSHKGKERANNEALDAWEIVESELPATLAISPPTQEISSTEVTPTDTEPPRSPTSTVSTAPTVHAPPEPTRQPKCKEKAALWSPPRERERRAPPPPSVPPPTPPTTTDGPPIVTVRTRQSPSTAASTSPGAAPPNNEGPSVVTVRTKKPPPPPPPKKKPHAAASSPLRGTNSSCILPDLDLDRAVCTPLPLTPVTGSPTSTFAFALPSEPASPIAAEEHHNPFHDFPSPAPRQSSGSSEHSDIESQHLHHYPGRPLPRRPRAVVDSTYAPHPDFQPVELTLALPNVPEGLLIDLDDAQAETPVVGPSLPVSTPLAMAGSLVADFNQLRPPPQPVQVPEEMHRQSSASSVELVPASGGSDYLDVTDLDVLISRIENDQRDGANYEALLMMSEFIGPASPVRTTTGPIPPASTSRQSSANGTGGAKTSVLLSGHIEVARRRVTKDGRVKLKLVLLGASVDRCGICMCQFKKADRARMSEGCRHAFHERCLARWLARSPTCPMCRLRLVLVDSSVGVNAGAREGGNR